MHRVASILLTLLAPAVAAAQGNVPPSVHSVVSGGYWQSGVEAGTYRVIIINEGWEHVTSRVFIEWVQEPRVNGAEPVVVSSVEPKLPFGEGLASFDATLKPAGKGRVRVILSGVFSAQPLKTVRAVLVATSPGRVTNAP